MEVVVMIDKSSVSKTIDAISSAFFRGQKVSAPERQQAARWLAGRQGLPGSYAGTFAGFPGEQKGGIVVFTGERFTSASARHILGEEASRALRLLRVRDAAARTALERADQAMLGVLERASQDPRNTNPGTYCCGKCTVGLWRNLLSGGLDRREERLTRGVERLRSRRDDKGGWRAFPFWYSVLALSEMDVPVASRELRHAAPVLERTVDRRPGAGAFAERRQELARRALGRL
ncbi:MAG TPA: hypothetical protein VM686_21260 [Polyangiaceae bacterium]|nr:hypothetical protein [Polyangiaceae bacterium]